MDQFAEDRLFVLLAISWEDKNISKNFKNPKNSRFLEASIVENQENI